MPPEIRKAEKKVLALLKEANGQPMSLKEIVAAIQKNDTSLPERAIRPSFWTLAASGKIEVDTEFRGLISQH